MKVKHIYILLMLLLCLFLFNFYLLAAENIEEQHTLYFFWGEGCPYCEEAKPELEILEEEYPQIKIKQYEVYRDVVGREKFIEISNKINKTPSSVPTFVLNENIWTGYSKKQGLKDIRAEIDVLLKETRKETQETINIPILGDISQRDAPIILTTLIIAFVDGFNPCSLWVLTFLLGLVIRSGSRKKMLIVGITFIATTSLTYGLFILGVFNILTLSQHIFTIRVAIALFAIFFALINIKDYFYFKKGLSFTIPDKFKPTIFKKMRKITNVKKSNISLIVSTFIMALGVTLMELPCTAGFPVQWSNIIIAQDVTKLMFYSLFALYLLIYFLDELFIFITATITLNISKTTEKQGRKLKLIGGMIMLFLGLTLIFNYEIMNSITGTLKIFGAATILSWIIIFINEKHSY
ncbi:MAG: thioredoxin [bacterium]